ncbi:hypothetical protein OG462_30120 [Streptomyces sp. NBC_01077]|uniref:hypothetical protein n=1 Tax=Streptomyces sp. NBC_01077 TaxID=2903746 RepID=UPI003869376D|nr:hypothetical protein OG462_30120 [Streptomyces sp. NBC_01077]
MSALFLAAAPVVSGEPQQGAGADADVTGLITADHGWGRSSNAATESSAGDTVVLATAADDHGWG